MKSEPVLIDRIQVVDRLRSDLNEETVMQIMESIPRVGGLLHPIAIRYVDGFAIDEDIIDGVPVLVAGRHRLEAMKRLGEPRIDCLIFDSERNARLWEISENLHRSDLDRLQRADHETEWMRIAEGDEQIEHGVQSVLSDGRKAGPQHAERGISLAARSLPIPGKSDAAKRVHLSRSNTISTKTTPEAKQAIRMAGLADSTRALVEIARVPAERQLSKVQEIVERRSAPKPEKPITADKALDLMASDIIAAHSPATLSSPMSAIDSSAEFDVDAVAGARAALDAFLGRFACLDAEQRAKCLSGRDLSDVFDAYTNS